MNGNASANRGNILGVSSTPAKKNMKYERSAAILEVLCDTNVKEPIRVPRPYIPITTNITMTKSTDIVAGI